MKNNPLPRLDKDSEIRGKLLSHCRLQPGEIWEDSKAGHKIGCLDATDKTQITTLMDGAKADLAVHDPPYNLIAFEERMLQDYIYWCERWIRLTESCLSENSSLYIWLGADQDKAFQPLPDFMIMMRKIPQFKSRSFITLRNQRGYGTQKNWMCIRQELIYYTKGQPHFQVQYTDIPKVLRGYYKDISGVPTENLQRSKSQNIRAGNVWVDIQQVFYRMEENVSGCYAQKPLKVIERIVNASSEAQSIVIDFFGHSGSTLLACERLGRKCYTIDNDPVYCEIMIRRLELYREKGLLGWQNGNAFEEIEEKNKKPRPLR